MLDIVMYLLVGFFFVFACYRLFSTISNNNRRFDLILIFLVLFLLVGRIFELILITNISSVGWSFFPAYEENDTIILFSKLPWIFFNLYQTVFNMYWFLSRYLIAIILLKLLFRLNALQYEEIKRVIFYNYMVVIAGLFFWLTYYAENSFDKYYSSYFFIASLVCYVFFLYYLLIKKTVVQTSWGVIVLICLNLYFLFTNQSQDLGGLLLVEIGTGLTILFVETFRKLKFADNATIGRVDRVNKLADLRVSSFQRSKRNLFNEINSKFRKN
jgi:hypothetical protein